MSFQLPGAGAFDDAPCTYGTSKLQFRGPKRALTRPYLAFLGGSETFGRFVERPFATLVEDGLNETCINLGCINGGLDTMLSDPQLIRIATQASAVVLQVPGAAGLSNRYYRVHPRRNDRFVQATPALRRLYPQVDFTRIHFVRHLLLSLLDAAPDRFSVITDELRARWTARMSALARRLGGRVLLLWLAYDDTQDDLGADPMLVSRTMIDKVVPLTLGHLRLPVQAAAQSEDLAEMRFGEMQLPIAQHVIGPDQHRQIAAQLVTHLARQ